MSDPREKVTADIALAQMIPNLLTIAAICAGVSAIRFGMEGSYTLAVQMILAAAVLDGLDGRIARLLKTDSKIGAELDSLADFLNFGVAPPLVIYFWGLRDTGNIGWIAVLTFSICCVLRLARFNVSSREAEESGGGAPADFFTGVPSPAGAMLVLLPMSVSFASSGTLILPDLLICAHMIVVGLLMISRIQTWSFKSARISRDKLKYFLLVLPVIGAAVLTYAWVTLVALTLCYIAMVVWCLFTMQTKRLFRK